jgi:transcriptional regulator with XRE-family HTH domain
MHELQKLIRRTREARRWTRSRLAEEASKIASVDVSIEWIQFLETAIQRVPEPELIKPTAAALGIPWQRVLEAMGMGEAA